MDSYLKHLQRVQVGESTLSKTSYIEYNFAKFLPTQDDPNYSVLEIGPGFGEFIQVLNHHHIYNLDIYDNDKTVLKYITKKYNIHHALCAPSIAKVANKLRQYDLIFILQVFEHIPKNQYRSFLTTIYNHLKPGGKIIITVPNGGNPLNIVERYGDLQHENAFTAFSLQDLTHYYNLKHATNTIQPYKIPPKSLINLFRILAQKLLHLILFITYLANGGIYQTIYHPNISLIITKNK